MPRRLTRVPLSLLLAGSLVLAPAAALAHDELLSTDPQDGSRAAAPEELTLVYSAEIADLGATVQVTDEDGQQVGDGPPAIEGDTVTQDLLDDLSDGEYAVAWRVTSSDGHPISGEFAFTVVAPDDEAAQSTERESQAEASEQAPAQETTEQASAQEATSQSTDDSAEAAPDPVVEDGSGGLPFWAWASIAAGVLGLGAALALTWSRNRR